MIAAEQLTTEPGTRPAVHDVTFVVRRGETFGLHGEPRDGVSILLAMLAGLQEPARGRVTIDGLDPVLDRAQLAGRLLLVGPDGTPVGLPDTAPISACVELLLLDRPREVADRTVPSGRTVVIASPDRRLLSRRCHRGISLRLGRITDRWAQDHWRPTP